MKTLYYCFLALLFCYYSALTQAECGGNSVACEPPTTDAFLSILPLKTCYEDGETVSNICKGHLQGPPINVCRNGMWPLPRPTCEGFSCGRPNIDKSVEILSDKSIFDAREKVEFRCRKENSIMEGSSFASCEKDGWNPSIKSFCSVKCDIPTIEYGAVNMKSPTKKGDTVKVTCDVGYVIQVGDSHRITCGDDGEWEHLPRCVTL
ncbi:putative sushi, von Willebrand factor type A [Apostichopus japonicus]|uniref:Putative sushi, von Willebrand factor type A n=1 Tax=Stichopus japonicus TaxID=307972 RepID=A0A2G8LMX4_STIJA|nr:putative sushi, von Willebrand factor type A [Apostichopus japonicus]